MSTHNIPISWTLGRHWVDVVETARVHWRPICLEVAGLLCSLLMVVLIDVTTYNPREIYRAVKTLTHLH